MIAALKSELQAVHGNASSLIDSVDAELRLNGALSEENIAALDKAIQVKLALDGLKYLECNNC